MSKIAKGVLAGMVLGAALVASQASAEEPDGAAVYNSICMACHMVGAAGAPIVGKADVWAEITAKGKEAMYLNAIDGIGAMPPKGGRTSLSDEEVMAAVDHMVQASQ